MTTPQILARIVSTFALTEEQLVELFRLYAFDHAGDPENSPGGAGWDPAEHPKWPAGTPGGKGGEFAPKDQAFGAEDAFSFDKRATEIGQKLQTAPIPLVESLVNAESIKSKLSYRLAEALRGDPDVKELMGMPVGDNLHFADTMYNPFKYESKTRCLVTNHISAWAASSGDHSGLSLMIQDATLKEFKLSARTDHFKMSENDMGIDALKRMCGKYAANFYNPMTHQLNLSGQKAVELLGKVQRKLVREMYNQTQEDLKKQGIDHLYLARGVHMSLGHRYAGTLAAFRKTELQPATSFSSSLYIANQFGATTMMVKVPRERVLSTFRTGFGCKSESEVVLLGGKVQTLWAPRKNTKMPVDRLWDAAASHVKPKTGAGKKATPATATFAISEDDEVLYPDDDLENADWPKRTDDVPPAYRKMWEEMGLSMGFYAWDESKHPRHDAGSEQGGEFAPANAMSPITTDAQKERAKALRLPPAWTEVMLSDDPNAALQATGIDAKGRKQYIYSAEHSAAASAEKFERLKAFNEAVPQIRKQSLADMKQGDHAAAALYTIAQTGLRVGGERDTKAEKQAYGVTTLEGRHVKVDGDIVTFAFTGKKGVDIHKVVEDPHLARFLKSNPAARKERVFKADAPAVRDYLKKVGGDEFMPKDFRTWHGTAKALEVIKSQPAPTTAKERQKLILFTKRQVAAHLGNTPTVAFKSYIDPAVWGRIAA